MLAESATVGIFTGAPPGAWLEDFVAASKTKHLDNYTIPEV